MPKQPYVFCTGSWSFLPMGGAEAPIPDVEGNFRSSVRAPLLTHATFSTWRKSWHCNMLQAWTVAE